MIQLRNYYKLIAGNFWRIIIIFFYFLPTKPEIKNSETAKPLVHKQGEIQFENVSFSYQEDRAILHDINFTVKPGQKLAIVGHSGSGKSTLARLLFRFYENNEGRILYDGQDISQVTQESLRQAIGIVPQDTVLFNETIQYNIEYAKAGATKDEIIHAAKLANIHDFIESLPDGYDTAVGERGLKLSGGEKQRVALCRSMINQPKLLFADEPTGNLDPDLSKEIMQLFGRFNQVGTTVLIASHDLDLIKQMGSPMISLHSGRVSYNGLPFSLKNDQGQS